MCVFSPDDLVCGVTPFPIYAGDCELDRPISITIDTSDRVYVGDWNHHISVFTSEGQFLTSFGQKGKRPGEFKYPRGLAVDVSGVVYVCDCFRNFIQLF